jgi:hypothetical protein
MGIETFIAATKKIKNLEINIRRNVQKSKWRNASKGQKTFE